MPHRFVSTQVILFSNEELILIGPTSDVLGPQWDIDVKELLDGEREALLVDHHGHVVQSVEVGQRL